MKKLMCLFSILFLLMQSCSSNDSTSNTPLTVEAVQNIATSGTWKVKYLDTQGGVVKTSDFQGYSFTFNQTNNSTTANYVNDNYQGTWNVDQIENQLYFSLDFQEASNLYYVGANWKIISITNNKIVLKISYDDGISGSYHFSGFDPIIYPDDLIFEKI